MLIGTAALALIAFLVIWLVLGRSSAWWSRC
jgi:hypothetical protein